MKEKTKSKKVKRGVSMAEIKRMDASELTACIKDMQKKPECRKEIDEFIEETM